MATAANMDLNSFSSEIADIARPNRFLFSLASGPSDITWDDTAKYYVKTAQLPGRTVNDRPPLFWFGMQDKRAGDPIYEDMTLNFHLDSKFKLRKIIEEWVEIISPTVANIRHKISTPTGGYKGVGKIQQVGAMGDIIATYFLHGFYPKNFTPVELGYETSDANSEFSVTFNVDYWSDSETGTSGTGVGLIEASA